MGGKKGGGRERERDMEMERKELRELNMVSFEEEKSKGWVDRGRNGA